MRSIYIYIYMCVDNILIHDTAQKGSSALLAALMRNLDAEIAAALGLASGGFFFDYVIFSTI